jgi:hypothetical protein
MTSTKSVGFSLRGRDKSCFQEHIPTFMRATKTIAARERSCIRLLMIKCDAISTDKIYLKLHIHTNFIAALAHRAGAFGQPLVRAVNAAAPLAHPLSTPRGGCASCRLRRGAAPWRYFCLSRRHVVLHDHVRARFRKYQVVGSSTSVYGYP